MRASEVYKNLPAVPSYEGTIELLVPSWEGTIDVMLCMSSLFVYSDPCTFRHRVSHVVSF